MSLLENGLRLLEMWWVKPQGTAATATLPVATSIALILEAVACLLQTGNLGIAARDVGAADPQEAISAFCHTFMLAIGVYALLGPIGPGVARPLILLLGWEGEVAGRAASHIRIIPLGSLSVSSEIHAGSRRPPPPLLSWQRHGWSGSSPETRRMS
ncbi:MAG: MATE family efflux transporter [Bacteroidota bacterium]